MIVWLASYPRSGNSLLRSVLKQAFGRNSFSVYNDKSDLGSSKERSRLVGHISYGMPWERFYELASKKDRLYFVKTHEAPADNAPAIYVVRDGRASVVSYWHYLRTFGDYQAEMKDVILGNVPFGSWSEHVERWSPERRPGTLLLRYETLIENPESAIRQIAEHFDMPIAGRYENNFSRQKEAFPQFFRSGSNDANISQIPAECSRLFSVVHGAMMKRLGYDCETVDGDKALRQVILDQQRRIWTLEGQAQAAATPDGGEEATRPPLLEASDILRRKDAKISHLNNVLKIREENLRATEQRLQATQQRLRATEQRLQAAQQRLRTTEQRLQAAQQRLRATEQRVEELLQELARRQPILVKIFIALADKCGWGPTLRSWRAAWRARR